MNLQIIQIKFAPYNRLKCNVCKDTNMINIGLVLIEPFEKAATYVDQIDSGYKIINKWHKTYFLWANTNLWIC